MKKYSLFIVCLLVSTFLLSACTSVPNSPIKYERKLGKYFESEENKGMSKSEMIRNAILDYMTEDDIIRAVNKGLKQARQART